MGRERNEPSGADQPTDQPQHARLSLEAGKTNSRHSAAEA
jgi:hypothetical protein